MGFPRTESLHDLADEIGLMTTVHKFPWPLEIVEDEDEHAAERRDLLAQLAEIDAQVGPHSVSEGPGDTRRWSEPSPRYGRGILHSSSV